MPAKKIVAMLLAGGQGSRLGELTKSMAKPAVPFGGKYRIIDFPLSNCVNSDIDTVGVLTQYEPLALNAYLGNGQAWDLDRNNGGVFVLPPYASNSGGRWYSGTADAIYQNTPFIDQYNPEYVLILSGDHIYKMNYAQMLRNHIKNNADATIAVLTVPIAEASRFGIMNTDEEGRITEFEEKPKIPRSNKASMGIYIFTWRVLREALLADHADAQSDKDFGKNIIPTLLAQGKSLFAYQFSGYWKDVGTIPSYYSTQMELLDEDAEFRLHDTRMHILSNFNGHPSHFIGAEGRVEHSMICNGCEICGEVYNSILSPGVTVEKGALVRDSILLPGSTVGEGAVVERTILNENAAIAAHTAVGQTGKITVIGENAVMEVDA